VHSALEVGAGTVEATRALASRGLEVTALEPDADMARALEGATRGLPDQLELKSRFEELDDGLDSLLGRESGGLDLSVGEWQRLALARARYQAAHLLLLDEPSSAADSDALATLTSALGHAGVDGN